MSRRATGLSPKQLKRKIATIEAKIIDTKQSLKAAEALAIYQKSSLHIGIALEQARTLNQVLVELSIELSSLTR